jgi:hypothetical protein
VARVHQQRYSDQPILLPQVRPAAPHDRRLHLAGDGGSPHLEHRSSPRSILPNEKLHANSIALKKTYHMNHTRCTATTGGGAMAAPSASFKTTSRTASTQRNSPKRKRRRLRSHQCNEIGFKSARRLHPRSTETSNYLKP